ncbi:MAG: uncharacterized protein JWL84_5941 [Rhodospirillales bacterium]|nr:uncharacterized protein [Rhodospirillales bacterium]
MAYDPRALANCILDTTAARGFGVTNMALNKIIYFSHGWHMALHDRPLVSVSFEAWDYGPVVPLLYHQFKGHGDQAISTRATRIDLQTGRNVAVEGAVSAETREHLDVMLEFYAPKSGPTLSHLSHDPQGPWASVRRRPNHPSMTIPDDLIKAYFRSKLQSRTGPSDGFQA